MYTDIMNSYMCIQASSIVAALDGILQQIRLDLSPIITDKVARPKAGRSDSLVASLILLVDRGCSESSEIEQVSQSVWTAVWP